MDFNSPSLSWALKLNQAHAAFSFCANKRDKTGIQIIIRIVEASDDPQSKVY